MSEINPTPSSGYAYGLWRDRPLESVTKNELRVGAGAIAGFEYSVLPRLCIGGEVSLNIVYTHGGQLWDKSEKVIGNEVITSENAVSPGLNEVSFKT